MFKENLERSDQGSIENFCLAASGNHLMEEFQSNNELKNSALGNDGLDVAGTSSVYEIECQNEETRSFCSYINTFSPSVIETDLNNTSLERNNSIFLIDEDPTIWTNIFEQLKDNFVGLDLEALSPRRNIEILNFT